MKLLSDIIKDDIIDELDKSIVVESIDGVTLTVCSTKWIRVGSSIWDDDNVKFEVVSYVKDETVVVNNAGFVGNGVLRVPQYLFGTQKQTNIEYKDLSNDNSDKLPLIWLLDGYKESGFGEESSIDRRVSCRLFFADYRKATALNPEVKDDSLRPMYQLAEQFVQTISDNYGRFGTVEDYSFYPRTRMGVISSKGEEASILDDSLSGVELELSFDVYKSYVGCDEGSEPVFICPDATIQGTLGSQSGYSEPAPSGGTLVLPDTEYRIFINQTQAGSVVAPTLDK